MLQHRACPVHSVNTHCGQHVFEKLRRLYDSHLAHCLLYCTPVAAKVLRVNATVAITLCWYMGPNSTSPTVCLKALETHKRPLCKTTYFSYTRKAYKYYWCPETVIASAVVIALGATYFSLAVPRIVGRMPKSARLY